MLLVVDLDEEEPLLLDVRLGLVINVVGVDTGVDELLVEEAPPFKRGGNPAPTEAQRRPEQPPPPPPAAVEDDEKLVEDTAAVVVLVLLPVMVVRS